MLATVSSNLGPRMETCWSTYIVLASYIPAKVAEPTQPRRVLWAIVRFVARLNSLFVRPVAISQNRAA